MVAGLGEWLAVIRAPPGGSYPLSWVGIWRSARSPCGGNLVGVVALIEICLRLPSGPKTVCSRLGVNDFLPPDS